MDKYEEMYKEYGFTSKSFSHCNSPDQIGKELMRGFTRKGEVTYHSSSKNCEESKRMVISKNIKY